MNTLASLRRDLRSVSRPEKAKVFSRFFKTGPGEYGEGDRFIGVVVPDLRRISRQYYAQLKDREIQSLIRSRIHEERLLGNLILVLKFQKGDEAEQRAVYQTYCRSTRWINNWDLVDSSAAYIVGPYLESRNRSRLHRWSRSSSVWERRISILSTFHYIKRGSFDETLAIAQTLVDDDHDLIHKAVGWMLREIGKRDRSAEESFLRRHHRTMPRTMLRYAIERFPEKLRLAYLASPRKGT